MKSLEKYIKSLSWDDFELLKDWMQDPCYDCPLEDEEMAKRFEKAHIVTESPLFVARWADMQERLSELETKLERLVFLNNLKDLKE